MMHRHFRNLLIIPHIFIQSCSGKREASLHLVTFDTTDLDACLEFVKRDVYNCRNHGHVKVQATGVGCMKHRDRISNTLGVEYVYIIILISNISNIT